MQASKLAFPLIFLRKPRNMPAWPCAGCAPWGVYLWGGRGRGLRMDLFRKICSEHCVLHIKMQHYFYLSVLIKTLLIWSSSWNICPYKSFRKRTEYRQGHVWSSFLYRSLRKRLPCDQELCWGIFLYKSFKKSFNYVEKLIWSILPRRSCHKRSCMSQDHAWMKLFLNDL